MNKIIVTVPQLEKGEWRFRRSAGGQPVKRGSASLLFNVIEKRLLRTWAKEKTAIVVKVGRDGVNESCDSSNASYLLYCLACFLEDYLTPEFLEQQVRKYQHASDKVGEN